MGNCNLPILMTLVVVSVVGFTSLAEAQSATCAQSLIPCANYINSTSPPANCCSSIKDAVDTQLSCLCGLYTSPGLLQSFGVTVEQALKLSKACGVDTDLTKCNVTAAAGPGSSTPGVVPGPDKGGAGRIGWTGFSTLFFGLASMMFY
ncbi:non-specific lipid transfer protein GPI-anchored 7-like [Alnus glutinosa]|uniref:non-specific lipid transfer protein GPI-anchored 7-like n=1 Tax=Alnus glutinosa TaxID=3517 RepID=UPI002D766487|nr:non-specific lipid transfer protein GPI-anchored 7-like [Alnus glutinosa]